MNEITGQLFQDREVHLDFNQYKNCQFIGCTLIYSAFGPVGFEGCQFIRSNFLFADAASNMLLFLRSLYHGTGKEGQTMIKGILNDIRTKQGLIPE